MVRLSMGDETLSGSKCEMSVPAPHTPATSSGGSDSTCDREVYHNPGADRHLFMLFPLCLDWWMDG